MITKCKLISRKKSWPNYCLLLYIGPYGLGNSSQYMPRNPMMANPMATSTEDEEVAAEDEEDMGVIETYSNYKPSKLKVLLFGFNFT